MTQPTVVFLHAFPLHAAMWDSQIAAVKADGWAALALDFPGFGRAHSSGQRTMQEFAQSIVDRLERKEIEEIILVGLSLGGYAAFRIMERDAGLVKGLVLADTRAAPDDSSARTKRLQMAARVESEGPGFLMTDFVPNLLSLNASPAAKERAAELAQHASGQAIYNALAALASRPDSRLLLEDIGVPTLVVVGAEDTVTPPSEAQVLVDAIPNARLSLIQNAGHLSNLEQPEAFNTVLLEFLQSFKSVSPD